MSFVVVPSLSEVGPGVYRIDVKFVRKIPRDIRLKIQKLILGQNVIHICTSAFDGCENLKEVVWNPSLRFIGDTAFRGTALKSITLPSSLKVVERGAFALCKDLTKVDLSETEVSGIRWYTFAGSNQLNEVVLPPSVVSMDHCSFGGCPELKIVVYKESPEREVNLEGDVFQGSEKAKIFWHKGFEYYISSIFGM